MAGLMIPTEAMVAGEPNKEMPVPKIEATYKPYSPANEPAFGATNLQPAARPTFRRRNKNVIQSQ